MSAFHVAGDWGTSRLRLFRIERGEVVDRREGPGIGALDASPEAVLRAALAPWRMDGEPASIRLGGMVGSRNGWIEIPYVDCPATAADWRRGAITIALDGIPVTIMAGLAVEADGVPDVMRGEETQIYGAIVLDPGLASGRHTIALPGTHSKWTTVADGRITDFRTFPTGELFALLRDRSTLVGPIAEAEDDPAADEAGFADGLARAGRGDPLLGALFSARTMQLRHGRSRAWARGFLSGLVIGSEAAEGAARLPGVGEIALIGHPALTARYAQALRERGIGARSYDGDATALAGLALPETLP